MHEANAFGEHAKFHHVGIVVPSIEAANPGLKSWHDPIQRVRVAFVRLHDSTLELVEPVGEDSPVRRNLERGGKLLHLCFEVPDLEGAVQLGTEAGFRALSKPAPAVAFDGRRICWVFSTVFGLIELLEASHSASRPAALDQVRDRK